MPDARPAIYYRAFDDAELVERSLAGESGAFDELVRRFRPGVVLITRRILGCDALAEDMAQDVMVRAHRALGLLKDPERFAPWLHAIARNSAVRAAQRFKRVEPLDEVRHAAGATPGPAEAALAEAERASIRRLVIALPAEMAEPLLLHYWEQWPLDRIAGFLGVPVSTVKWRLYQGRRRIEPRLTALLMED